MKYLSIFIALVLSSLFFVACSDAPENDKGAKASPVIPDIVVLDKGPLKKFNEKIKISEDTVWSKPGEQGGQLSAEAEALKNKNLRQPIVYGVGAAGIRMNTSLADSKTLLSQPPVYGPDADGWAVYNEQVVVLWKDEGERTPFMIVPTKGYLGTMTAGKFGELSFQTKFTDYKGDDPQAGAQKLSRELYLELEKVEDQSYDCLATGRCALYYGTDAQANLVIVLPGAVFLIAKEEFQLAEVRIIRDVALGMLANNLDILTGDLLIADEEPFVLGQTHKEIFDRMNASSVKSTPDIYIRSDYIGYSWSGFWYSFHRTNYVSTVVEAETSDITKTVSLAGEYPSYLTFNGLRILMKQSKDKIEFSLETNPDQATKDIDTIVLNETEVESKFKMNMRILKQNSQRFADEFSAFLKRALSVRYDVVNVRVSGYQDSAKANKDISGSVIAYNKADLKGRAIEFEVSEEQEKLRFLQVSLIDNSLNGFDQFILPQTNEDVVRVEGLQPVINEITGEPVLDQNGEPKLAMKKLPYFSELLGIKLNDLVLLSDIDALGRQEATAQMLASGSSVASVYKERTAYVEQGTFEVPIDNRPKPREQGFVSVGYNGTALGLKIIGKNEQGQYARIVSIEGGNLYGQVHDVCGLEEAVSFKVGMTDVEALHALNTAIDRKKQADPSFNCDHFTVKDTGAVGRLKEIYFPGERMKLNFNERALSSVGIYLPLNNVNEAMPEVNQ